LLLPEEQMDEAWEPCKTQCYLVIWGALGRKIHAFASNPQSG
jgi:hypothetical protein